MKRVAVIAAALVVVACKGKETPSLDTLPKMTGAAADTTQPMDTAMKMADAGAMKKAAPAPAPAKAAAGAAVVAAAPAPAPAAAAPAPAPAAMAPATAAAKPAPVVHEMSMVGSVEEWRGLVKSVNYQTRHIVITDSHGVAHPFMVPESVPNLDKVVKGAQVSAKFVEAIAIYLQQKSAPPGAASMTTMTVSPEGMPQVEHVMVKEYSAKITAINPGTRTVTVVGEDGVAGRFHVDASVGSMSNFKVGDHIVVRASEAVLLSFKHL